MNKLTVSISPHISTKYDTQAIMKNVICALFPVILASTYIFGFRALVIMAISVAAAVLSEYLWCVISKKENTISDYSAVITGLLLAMCLPVSVPLFMPAIGSFFAIIIVKCLFGGLGNNFVNPALAGRAFLLANYGTLMVKWIKPLSAPEIFGLGNKLDAVTTATPLNVLKQSGEKIASYWDLFIGNTGGSMGEVCAVAILIGFIYLIFTKIIKPYAPLAFIVTVGLGGWIFGYNGYFSGDFLYSILSGGVMLGAVFMLTDYTTSPSTNAGNLIFGVIAGLITIFIRTKGGMPEGVCYSILIANILAPQLDKIIVPKKFGYKRKGAVTNG